MSQVEASENIAQGTSTINSSDTHNIIDNTTIKNIINESSQSNNNNSNKDQVLNIPDTQLFKQPDINQSNININNNNNNSHNNHNVNMNIVDSPHMENIPINMNLDEIHNEMNDISDIHNDINDMNMDLSMNMGMSISMNNINSINMNMDDLNMGMDVDIPNQSITDSKNNNNNTTMNLSTINNTTMNNTTAFSNVTGNTTINIPDPKNNILSSSENNAIKVNTHQPSNLHSSFTNNDLTNQVAELSVDIDQTTSQNEFSSVPNNIHDNTSLKLAKNDEETETIHLNQSPDVIKTKSMAESNNNQTNNIINSHNASNQLQPFEKSNEQSQHQQQEQSSSTAASQNYEKIQAYAMLDFDSFTFYVQTMQILLGRLVDGDPSTDSLDIHLGNQKAISRRHAKMFYNFGNQRFELSVLGRNGAFVDGNFIEKGVTVPLLNGTKIQIGETEFVFILPSKNKELEPSTPNVPNDLDVADPLSKKDTKKEKVKEKVKDTTKDKTKPKTKAKKPAKPKVKAEKPKTTKSTKDKEKEKDKENKDKDKELQIEHLDNLVANFDEIRKDLHNDHMLLTNGDPKVLDIVFDLDSEKRELEIEKEIGKVLARESSEQAEQAAEQLTQPTNLNNKPNDIINDNFIKMETPNLHMNSLNIKQENMSTLSKADKNKVKPKRQAKAKKKVYTLEEIPEEYRNKPNLPYSILITDCLRQKGTERGMSLSEIYKGIQDLYPYYFYCPDGWQSSVRHNLSLNKSFRKISKEGKGWLWGVNEEVIAEKDKTRQKQLENAKAKGKTLPRQVPKALHGNLHLNTPGGTKVPLSSSSNTSNTSKNNFIPVQMNNNNIITSESLNAANTQSNQSLQIKQSNPAQSSTQSTTSSSSNKTANKNDNMSANTKRALAYLQKELIFLTKSRKMYDRATSTEILTKALAMTISQVDQAAKNFAIKGFPLVTLIDKNPGHVTKILTAALNAATLQVCKQKGLTPHLPPKNPTPSTNTPAPTPKETNNASSTNAQNPTVKSESKPENKNTPPISFIKQEPGDSTSRQGSTSSVGTTSKINSASPAGMVPKPGNPIINKARPINPPVSKPSAGGPKVFQFSNNTPKPPFKQQNVEITPSNMNTNKDINSSIPITNKPSFMPSIKPISKPTTEPITDDSNKNSTDNVVKPPIKLSSGMSNIGIMKPQYYNKGKTTTTTSSGISSLNNKSIDDEEIKRSIAKFGKPTVPKPSVKADEFDNEIKMNDINTENNEEVKDSEAFGSNKITNTENELVDTEKKNEVKEVSKNDMNDGNSGNDNSNKDQDSDNGADNDEDDDEDEDDEGGEDELQMMLENLEHSGGEDDEDDEEDEQEDEENNKDKDNKETNINANEGNDDTNETEKSEDNKRVLENDDDLDDHQDKKIKI